MKNNYYTPDIFELHVGLECEIQEPGFTGWEEEALNVRDLTYILAYHPNRIRVKCLDEEDIKSLGFKWDYSGERHLGYENCQVYINHYPTEKKGMPLAVYDHSGQRYRGVIRNITEFRNLLIQLEINTKHNE